MERPAVSELDCSAPRHNARIAEAMLLLATLLWGSSFTWAKASGDAINRVSGAGIGSTLGPAMLMGLRFLIAGVVWLVIFPDARRGWTRVGMARGLLLGVLLGGGLILQVLGLNLTSEAVSAFLTSLTILWVPSVMTIVLRRPPAPVFWGGVFLAAIGIWLMTGAMPHGLGLGEALGFACSILFTFHLIALNAIVPLESASRMTAAQLIVAGMIGVAVCLFSPIGRAAWVPSAFLQIVSQSNVWINLVLLILLPTVGAFGLMSKFQPVIDPSRAALIYLLEPIFAAAYAWMAIGRSLSGIELCGAALILLANFLVEFISARRKEQATVGV